MGILYVFLVFQTAGLAEKIRRPRSGIYSEVPLSAKLLLQRSQLQAVSVEHTETIERLRTENKLLSQKLHEVSDILEGDIPNRKPPHY